MLPMTPPYTVSYRLRLADQYLALGRVNLAEYALHDTLPHTGDNPYLLQRLAMVYLIKGDPLSARLYLRLLARDLIHAAWARTWLARLAADPTLADQPEIAAARALMLDRDDMLEISDMAEGRGKVSSRPPVALTDLLDANPRNRRALDTLMALYLVAGYPQGVAREIHRLAEAGEQAIPAAWEDALLLVMAQPDSKVDLAGLTISEAGRRRFERYQHLLRIHGGDPRAAWPDVQSELGETCLAYLLRKRLSP
jgi:hypothetical protein